MSIWDAPNPSSTDTTTPETGTGRVVPVMDPAAHVMRTEAGPLLTSAGRGVVGGRPYGEQLQDEAEDMHQQYALRPTFASRLRAATRSALGR